MDFLRNFLSLAFILGGVYYFFFAGPSQQEMDASKEMFVTLLCDTDMVVQVDNVKNSISDISRRSLADIATGAKGLALPVVEQMKGIYNTAWEQMTQAQITMQTIKRLGAMKEGPRGIFLDMVAESSLAKCPKKVRQKEVARATVDALLTLIPKGAYIY